MTASFLTIATGRACALMILFSGTVGYAAEKQLANSTADAATSNAVVEINLQLIDPKPATNKSSLAVAAAQAGDITTARQLLDEALETGSAEPTLQADSVVVLLYEGNFRAALLTLDRLRQEQQASFNQPAMLLNRSLALRGLGRYAEASADYQQFLYLTNDSENDARKPTLQQQSAEDAAMHQDP